MHVFIKYAIDYRRHLDKYNRVNYVSVFTTLKSCRKIVLRDKVSWLERMRNTKWATLDPSIGCLVCSLICSVGLITYVNLRSGKHLRNIWSVIRYDHVDIYNTWRNYELILRNIFKFDVLIFVADLLTCLVDLSWRPVSVLCQIICRNSIYNSGCAVQK